MPAKNPFSDSASQSRQFLTEQITIESPGTILNDVRVLLDFIGTHGMRTGSNRGNLPAAPLPEINARLSSSVELHLSRPLLRDYPNIAGLYILLRVLQLIRADGAKLSVDGTQARSWNALNPCEQYFALFESWMLEADGQVLGGPQDQRDADGFSDLLYWIAHNVGPRWKTFDENVHTYGTGMGGPISTWNIQLMTRLGLIEVAPRPLSKRSRYCSSRGWIMMKAKITPWGQAVLWALYEHCAAAAEDDEEDFFLAPHGEEEPGMMQSIFQPFFPEYQKVFGRPEPITRSGMYLFKVGLHPRYGPSDVWRRLAAPDTASLYDLCGAILKAFDFWDDDHLHQFQYRDSTGRSRVYWHPYTDEGPYSDEITLGESDLPEKQILNFKFDFGNTWCFVLRLEQIAIDRQRRSTITVVDSCGASPKQYAGME
jgi:hypothetical protein